MHIVVVGFNHQSAPVEVREQASFTGAAIASVHEELKKRGGVHEVIILSTCNRTEIYTVSVCPLAGETAARSLLASAEPYLYAHRDRDAVDHLFRVASGIDSLVLGETEILGQVRKAAELAREVHVSGRILGTLFQQALHAGKRARSETKIGHHALSTASASVALVRAQAGDLAGKTVLLIGTGMIAGQTVDALRNDGVGRLIVASGTASRAIERAGEWTGKFPSIEAIPFEDLAAAVPRADVVIAASTCAKPILTASMIGPRATALVVVDVGVPRNVDSQIAAIPRVQYFDIDDLNQVVEANLAERRREVAPVEKIVRTEVEGYETWLRTLGVQPVITTLRGRIEQIRSQELEKAMRRMGELSPRDREAVEALTRSIVSKILHNPTIRLKEHANDGRGYQFAEAVRDLFDLEQVS